MKTPATKRGGKDTWKQHPYGTRKKTRKQGNNTRFYENAKKGNLKSTKNKECTKTTLTGGSKASGGPRGWAKSHPLGGSQGGWGVGGGGFQTEKNNKKNGRGKVVGGGGGNMGVPRKKNPKPKTENVNLGVGGNYTTKQNPKSKRHRQKEAKNTMQAIRGNLTNPPQTHLNTKNVCEKNKSLNQKQKGGGGGGMKRTPHTGGGRGRRKNKNS